MDAPAEPLTREHVAADLRAVVGRCRSLGDFDNLTTPALDALAASTGRARDDIPDLLAEAVEVVEDDRYRQFLEILLPFPFRPGSPWPQLGSNRAGPGRGEEAARTAFDLSWDACNRSGQLLDGRSRREWAELLLADAVLVVVERPATGPGGVTGGAGDDLADAVPAGDASRSGREPTDGSRDLPGAGRPRRITIAVGVMVTVAALGAVLAWAFGGFDDDPVTTAVVKSSTSLALRCTAEVSLDPELAASPDASEIRASLADLLDQAGGLRSIGCPLAAAHRWQDLVVEEHDSGEDGLPGALVQVRSSHQGLYLGPEAYGQYRRIGSGDGSLAQRVAGLPTKVETFADGHSEVTLSKGVVMFQATAGAPYFWIAAPYVSWWRQHPELGMPTGNPMPDLSQDFVHGRVLAVGSATGGPEEIMASPSDPPLPSGRARHILHQSDGTSWWIDEHDRRYWIPTGGVWQCLGADSVTLSDPVSGAALAALPFAGHARCPK